MSIEQCEMYALRYLLARRGWELDEGPALFATLRPASMTVRKAATATEPPVWTCVIRDGERADALAECSDRELCGAVLSALTEALTEARPTLGNELRGISLGLEALRFGKAE
jgi:hypothetical protein